MVKRIIIYNLIIISLLSGFAFPGYSEQSENLNAKKTINSAELKKLIDNKKNEYLLIDVRTYGEYNSGHIPTAINIPYTEIRENIIKMPKDKLIIVYCRTGRRSGIAKTKLTELGYKNVIDFGSIYDWKYELVAGKDK